MVAAVIALKFAGTPTAAALPAKVFRGRLIGMKSFFGVVGVIQDRRNRFAQ